MLKRIDIVTQLRHDFVMKCYIPAMSKKVELGESINSTIEYLKRNTEWNNFDYTYVVTQGEEYVDD